MSMIWCQGCDRLIDSDDDPECFVGEYEPGVYRKDVLCERCRDDDDNRRPIPMRSLPAFAGPACSEALACGVRGPCSAPDVCPTDGCQLVSPEP